MSRSSVRQLIVLVAILASPLTARAQEATVSGAVSDTSGGVMPGVTITALHETTGNTFVTVTDDLGVYRIAVRPGRYRITAELQGFATATRSGVELLVGQTAVIDLEMGVSAQTVELTVSAAAPLLDVASSVVSSNIDPRQMQALPLQGQLDGPHAAGADEPHGQRGNRGAAGSPGVLPDQCRRPAGHAAHLLLAATGALQPGRDRRVRADHEPV